jgi:ABC-type phosphate/phosphonate transport system substrate-binding protein
MTGYVAGFPMYDFGRLALANDALWQAIFSSLKAAGLTDVPSSLERSLPIAQLWTVPRLLLVQSCGYPVMTSLRDRVRLVATPCYRATGCTGAWHRSALVVRADDHREDLVALHGARCVANQRHSNTGMNLFRAAIAPLAKGRPFFESVTWSSSHRRSLARVAAGEADLTAIDAVTYAQLGRIEPDLVRQTRIIGWTEATPGLPFITAAGTSDATIDILRAALLEIAATPACEEICDELLLDGFEILPETVYQRVIELERRASDLGYPELR